MVAEDDDDSSGIFAIYDEVAAGQWAKGGKILHLSDLLMEMGGDVSEERKTRAESTVRRSSCIREYFGIPG